MSFLTAIGSSWSQDARVRQLLENPQLQALGEKIFFDARLSEPPGQSCASCHDPAAGWTGPDSAINRNSGIYPGAIHTRFGNRKPSSAAYATLAPPLHTRMEEGELLFVGGNFWDGRATGQLLGNPAADQAQGPFLNPVEHNLPDAAELIRRVESGAYADQWRQALAQSAQDSVAVKFGILALSIAAFEHSKTVNAFSSKYDAWLKGKARLSSQEAWGMKLFDVKGKCADCHPRRPGPKGEAPLFTDFTFDNLGIPANPDNPWYKQEPGINPDGPRWVDLGLGAFLKQIPQYAALAEANLGKHRVPTLRNVDKRPSQDFVKAYGHNGYFKSLEAIVHFYNTRDLLPESSKVKDPQPGVNCWPVPEVKANLNTEEMGNLKLSPAEEAAIVAFMKTLNDGYSRPQRPPSKAHP